MREEDRIDDDFDGSDEGAGRRRFIGYHVRRGTSPFVVVALYVGGLILAGIVLSLFGQLYSYVSAFFAGS